MTDDIAVAQVTPKVSRPVGVWILTIYALLFVGIAPLLLSIFLLVSGNPAVNGVNVLLSLPINLGVIISAIGAWQGKEKARKSLLVFITLHYVFVAINNALFIFSGQVPYNELMLLCGRVLRGFIVPAVYIWYFNKYTTTLFYN